MWRRCSSITYSLRAPLPQSFLRSCHRHSRPTTTRSFGTASDAWHDPEFARHWDASDASVTNPARTEQLELLSELVTARCATTKNKTVLEFGCGSGQVAELILSRIPGVNYMGLDFSQPMLDLAAQRLAPQIADQVCELRHVDFMHLDPDSMSRSVMEPPAAILCVQALHEVAPQVKSHVYAVARSLLSETSGGGCLYILDRFGPHGYTPEGRQTLEKLAPELQVLWQRNISPEESKKHMTYQEYQQYLDKDDHIEEVGDTLQALKAAGFNNAHCVYKYLNRALICAI